MDDTISIKNLRENLSDVADKAENGKCFTVVRRSKLSFKIVPFTSDADEKWETVVDFTEGGKKSGVKIDDALKVLKKMNK